MDENPREDVTQEGSASPDVACRQPPRSEEFEKLVERALRERVCSEFPDADPNVFHRKRYRGKSGNEHEIDVAVEFAVAGFDVVLLAECKWYPRRSVGKDELLEFSAVLDDIPCAHKGVVFTTVGFEQGARNHAKAQGIGLAVVAEDKCSWEVVLRAMLPPFIASAVALASRRAKASDTSSAEAGASSENDIFELARHILRRHRMSFDLGTSTAVNCYPVAPSPIKCPQPSVVRIHPEGVPRM